MALTQAAVTRNARRTERRLFTLTLRARRAVSANTTRFTFDAPELGTFEPLAPDEFFALVVPQPDGGTAVRWYTVRAHRPSSCEIDVDIVMHGDAGPASTWANHAVAGDEVGFREAAAPYLAPPDRHQLLVADETALPALAAILEAASPTIDATVLAEVPRPDDVPVIDSPVPIQWFHRGDAAPGTAVLPALRQLVDDGLPDLGYAWLCGEAAIATGARRLLVKRGGVDPGLIMFSGYWRLGQARQ